MCRDPGSLKARGGLGSSRDVRWARGAGVDGFEAFFELEDGTFEEVV